MDGEAGARCVPPAFGVSLMQNQQGHQADLPVMSMDDLRLRRKMPRYVNDGLGKEYETFGIVRVIIAVLLIETRAIKKMRLIHEINCQTVQRMQRPDLPLNSVRSQRKIQPAIQLLKGRKLFR